MCSKAGKKACWATSLGKVGAGLTPDSLAGRTGFGLYFRASGGFQTEDILLSLLPSHGEGRAGQGYTELACAEHPSRHLVLSHLEGRATYLGLTHCSFIFRK